MIENKLNMKKIDEFVDKLEQRVEGILKGVSHGQEIDRIKVKASVKKEVIALCKDFYEGGHTDGAFALAEDTAIWEDDEYCDKKEEDIKSMFGEL